MWIPITEESAKSHMELVKFDILQSLGLYETGIGESDLDELFKSTYPEVFSAFLLYNSDFMQWAKETEKYIKQRTSPDSEIQIAILKLSEAKDESSKKLFSQKIAGKGR